MRRREFSRVSPLQVVSGLRRQIVGHVTQRVVGAGLIGHDVGVDAVGEQPGHDVGGIAEQTDRQRDPFRFGLGHPSHRREVVGRDLVEIAMRDATLEHVLVDVDDEHDAVVHRHREGLGTTHAARAGGDRERAGKRAVEPLAGDLGEALEGALQDALRADVDPRPGRHLPVHRQALVFEPAELVPVGPVGYEVRVGDQHSRRPFVGAHHTHGFARLDQHRLVAFERLEGSQHRPVRIPRPCRAAGASVHDQLVGVLGDLGIEVVLQHPVGGFLRPPSTRQLGTPWCGNTGDGCADRSEGVAHVLQICAHEVYCVNTRHVLSSIDITPP